MTSWKTTLGGSLSAAGQAMTATGVLTMLQGAPSKFMMGFTITGVLLGVLGTFFAHLFAADQTAVIKALTAQQAENVQTIATKQDK